MKLKITITIDVGMVAESGYRRGIKYHVIEESRSQVPNSRGGSYLMRAGEENSTFLKESTIVSYE